MKIQLTVNCFGLNVMTHNINVPSVAMKRSLSVLIIGAASALLLRPGSECPSPIKCLSSRLFTFCFSVNGTIVQQNAKFTCPERYKCVEDPYGPCVLEEVIIERSVAETGTTIEETTITNIPTTTATLPRTPPTACSGPAFYPAENCNQYYQCFQLIWWWELKLMTCPPGQAFDGRDKCAPLSQIQCIL